jgi:hypothetical protein
VIVLGRVERACDGVGVVLVLDTEVSSGKDRESSKSLWEVTGGEEAGSHWHID